MSGNRKSAAPWSRIPIALRDAIPPVLVLTALCAPVLGLGYFWDDYFFLTFKGHSGPGVYLFPDPDATFYRPVSQSLYFLFLRAFGDATGWWGHVLNALVLVLSVALLVSLASRLRGRTAGIMAGLVFAVLAPIPSLVAWVSCCQDLFAIAFLLATLLLRHSGKDVGAVLCAAGALFSKESALAVFPLLVFWDHLVGRRPTRTRFSLAAYGGLTLVWLLVHPAIRMLILRGFESAGPSYVGLSGVERGVTYLLHYTLTLLNVPVTGLSTTWPADLTWACAVAAVLLAGGLWFHRRRARDKEADRIPVARAIWIGVLIAVPSLLLPSFLVKHWATYFATIPAVGAALVLGTLLANLPRRHAGILLVAFLVLGVWCRGIDFGERVAWSERSFVVASRAMRALEGNVKRLLPQMPSGSQILVSVTGTGIRGIRQTLLDGQALRLLYDDPALRTLPPERYRPGYPANLLLRVTSDLAVVSIDPDSLRVEWSGTGQPHPWEINRPIRGIARGLAAAGETERAVRILTGLAGVEQGMERAYDQRLIAMIRLSEGRRKDAAAILDSTDGFAWGVAVEIVKKLFTESTSNAGLDSCAFEAFELSPTDPEVSRYLMKRFRSEGLVPEAVHFARRLVALRPGDPEAVALLKEFGDRRRRPI
jgi:hypothetical protein